MQIVKLAFENWKQLAKLKIKEFNNNNISENELFEWMKENKDSEQFILIVSNITIFFCILNWNEVFITIFASFNFYILI